jgi:N-formylglutamate deformylase
MKTPLRIVKPQNALPLVFDSPHSGINYPADFNYACDFSDLEQCEDRFVDDLFASAPLHGAAFLCANFPRSYIDVNRSPTDIDPQLMNDPWPHGDIAPSARSDAGIGLIRRLVKPGVPVYDRMLPAREVRARIKNYYEPYHNALQKLIEDSHYDFGQVWHVNCHSMPSSSARPKRALSIAGRTAAEADIVLGDRDGTTCAADFTHGLRDFFKNLGYAVTVNDPFKGVELVRRYSNPARGYHSIQIEINMRLYMDETTLRKNKNYEKIKTDIDRMIAFCADYARANLTSLAAD